MKIPTVKMLEKGKGEFVETDIPDGSWVSVLCSLDTAVPATEARSALPLPAELMQISGAKEGRKLLRDHVEKERMVTLSHVPITPQLHVLGYIGPSQMGGDEMFPDIDYHGRGHWKYALVADKPFGVLCWENCDYYPDDYSLEWEDFVVAGKVKGDKITTGPSVRHPNFTRVERWRWARLSELAECLGEDPMVLWEFYFHIGIGSSQNALGASEHILHVRCGDKPSDAPFGAKETDAVWWNGVPLLGYTAYEQFRPCGGWYWKEQPPHKMWVPAGWAMQVCYLHHFGFRPPQK